MSTPKSIHPQKWFTKATLEQAGVILESGIPLITYCKKCKEKLYYGIDANDVVWFHCKLCNIFQKVSDEG
jgi:hypothetical protein